jgi:diguanylate cyclase
MPAVTARSRRFAQTALEHMARFDIAPTPENFTVWYHYYSGESPALRRAMDILISNHQDFSAETCADLYHRFFGLERQTITLRQLSSKIEAAVSAALGMLVSANKDARSYGEVLGESAAELDGGGNVTLVRDVVSRVIGETRSMIDRSDVLEKQLSQSTAEIGELRKQVASASREAMTDPLTGVGNRKMFEYQMKKALEAAMEHGHDLALVMLDIDHFKRFNDSFGHQIGDMVLRLVARSLIEGIQATDHAVRYGGEEFAILLPETQISDALVVAERLRSVVASKTLVKRGTKETLGNVTMSIGVSAYRLGEPVAHFIERADAALYAAKQSGRNRVLSENDLTDRSAANVFDPNATAS